MLFIRLPALALAIFLMVVCTPATANTIDETRSAYAAALQTLRQAETGLAEALRAQAAAKTRLETAETTLQTRYRVRAEQVQEIRAALQASMAELFRVAQALQFKKTAVQSLSAEWDELVDNPQAYSTRQRRELREALSAGRAEIEAFNESLGSLQQKIKEHYAALDAAAGDLGFLEAETAALQRAETAKLMRDGASREAAQALSEARKSAMERQVALIDALAEASPPLIRSLTLTGPKGPLYKAAWVSETTPIGENQTACGLPPGRSEIADADIAPAAQERLYRQAVQGIEDQLKQLNAGLAEARKKQDQLTSETQTHLRLAEQNNERFLALVKRTDDIKQLQLVTQTAIDAGVFAFENAVSGGFSVAGREAAEQIADQVAERLKRKYAQKAAAETAEQGLERAYRTATKQLIREAAEAETARLQKLGITKGSQAFREDMARFRGAAEEQIRKTAREEFRKAFRNNKAWRSAREGLATAWVIAARRQIANAAKVAEAKIMQPTESPGAAAALGLTFDAIEGISDRLIRRAALSGHERLAQAAFNRRAMQNAQKALLKLTGSINPDKSADLLKLSPGDIAGIADAVAKAVGTYSFTGEHAETQRKLLETGIENVMIHKVIGGLNRKRAALDADIETTEAAAAELRRRMTTAKLGLRLHRRQIIAIDEPVRRFPAEITVSLSLHGLLSTPPEITIDGQRVNFGEAADPAGRALWSGKLELADPGADVTRLPIKIAGRDLAGREIDSGSSTRGIAKVDGDGWQFYEPGSETCHTLQVAPAYTLKLSVNGLTVEHSIR